jgi:hypothetical protein
MTNHQAANEPTSHALANYYKRFAAQKTIAGPT